MARNIYGGGANTNANGLLFEQETSLDAALSVAGYTVINNHVFLGDKQVAVSAGKHDLYKKILGPQGINYKKYISKRLLPDEALYNLHNKTVYIIEKSSKMLQVQWMKNCRHVISRKSSIENCFSRSVSRWNIFMLSINSLKMIRIKMFLNTLNLLVVITFLMRYRWTF